MLNVPCHTLEHQCYKPMKFKSKTIPAIWAGITTTEKKTVIPNQSMSLEEILKRFTRGETLDIGREPQYHESADDLEKISNADLVDKQEFVDKLKDTQREYSKQEKRKADNEKKRLEKLALEKIEAEIKAANQPPTAK